MPSLREDGFELDGSLTPASVEWLARGRDPCLLNRRTNSLHAAWREPVHRRTAQPHDLICGSGLGGHNRARRAQVVPELERTRQLMAEAIVSEGCDQHTCTRHPLVNLGVRDWTIDLGGRRPSGMLLLHPSDGVVSIASSTSRLNSRSVPGTRNTVIWRRAGHRMRCCGRHGWSRIDPLQGSAAVGDQQLLRGSDSTARAGYRRRSHVRGSRARWCAHLCRGDRLLQRATLISREDDSGGPLHHRLCSEPQSSQTGMAKGEISTCRLGKLRPHSLPDRWLMPCLPIWSPRARDQPVRSRFEDLDCLRTGRRQTRPVQVQDPH